MSQPFIEIPFSVTGGFWSTASNFPPPEVRNTARAGESVWIRAGDRVEVGNNVAQLSATNVGARLFSLNTQRASIAGGLVSGRLPYAGLIRYQNAALFYLSELQSQQVYINESAVSGLTTSSTAGRLRVAVSDGAGGYSVYDAGFDPPTSTGTVTSPAGGSKAMVGNTGVALAPWRTATNAIGPPSPIVYDNLTSGDVFHIVLPSAVSGQDGWIFCGTRTGDTSGTLRTVRYVYLTARGTFTATNGSPSITAGSNTFFLQDFRKGDVVTISGGSYTISSVDSQTTMTLTANFTGSTGSGKTATFTEVSAEWYDGELGDIVTPATEVFRPPRAAGVLSVFNRAFLWGTYGDEKSGTAVTGPGITPLLANNPEHVGLDSAFTSQNDDLINVLAGDETLYLMTPNTLETITFTGNPDDPFLPRIIHQPGFASAQCGTVYKNQFYGYVNRPIRTMNGDVDATFGTPVLTSMASWNAANTVVAVDTKNEAVLYCNYDGSSTTTVIPYLVQMGIWNPPFTFTGQVTDYAVVNGTTYLIVLTGGNYRVYTWEGGTGAAAPYIATQFYATPDRAKIKGIVFTGNADTMRFYWVQSQQAANFDVSDVAQAQDSYLIQNISSYRSLPEVFYNSPAIRAVAMRAEFTIAKTAGKLDQLVLRLMPLQARK